MSWRQLIIAQRVVKVLLKNAELITEETMLTLIAIVVNCAINSEICWSVSATLLG